MSQSTTKTPKALKSYEGKVSEVATRKADGDKEGINGGCGAHISAAIFFPVTANHTFPTLDVTTHLKACNTAP